MSLRVSDRDPVHYAQDQRRAAWAGAPYAIARLGLGGHRRPNITTGMYRTPVPCCHCQGPVWVRQLAPPRCRACLKPAQPSALPTQYTRYRSRRR